MSSLSLCADIDDLLLSSGKVILFATLGEISPNDNRANPCRSDNETTQLLWQSLRIISLPIISLGGDETFMRLTSSSQIRLRWERRSCGLSVRGRVLYECPTLQRLNDEVLARRQRLIAICAARLCPTLVEITIQPKTKLATRSKRISVKFSDRELSNFRRNGNRKKLTLRHR